MRGVEISLFARPCAGWDASAMVRSPTGALLAPCARGQDQLVAVVDEIRRAADLGIRSVLVSDVGVLAVFGRLRAAGALPAQMQAKVSVMLPAANPAAARLFADLGADTLNLPTDLTLAQVSAIRSATPVPLDVYVEAPDNLGGFVRHYEMPRLIEVAAPVYVKFGLRNAPDIYPSGTHLQAPRWRCPGSGCGGRGSPSTCCGAAARRRWVPDRERPASPSACSDRRAPRAGQSLARRSQPSAIRLKCARVRGCSAAAARSRRTPEPGRGGHWRSTRRPVHPRRTLRPGRTATGRRSR